MMVEPNPTYFQQKKDVRAMITIVTLLFQIFNHTYQRRLLNHTGTSFLPSYRS